MNRFKIPMICIIVIMLAVLLSGCMKMHIDIIWNEDNSASIAMTVGVTTSTLSMLDMTESEMQQQLRESIEEEADDDDEYTIEDFSDEDYSGIIATVKIDDITNNSEDSLEYLSFSFEESGGKKTYTVIGDFMDSDVLGDEGMDEFSVDTQISIVMPGTIVSHNATEKDGNRLTWTQDNPNFAVSIYARSEADGGLLWLWIALGGIVVLAGIAVVIILVLRKNKTGSQDLPAGQYGAQGYAPPGYAPVQQPYGAQQYQPPYDAQQYQPPGMPPAVPPDTSQVEPPIAEIPPQQATSPVYGAPEPEPVPVEPIVEPPGAPGPEPGPVSVSVSVEPAVEPPGAPESEPVPVEPAVEPPGAPEPEPATRLCTQCNATLPEGTKFCGSCGTPVQ